jgi:hypothetical protein
MKQIKAQYLESGHIKIPSGYAKVPAGSRCQKGDFYIEKKYKFIPRFKYNQEYKMPKTQDDREFLDLCYENCLLVSQEVIKNKHQNAYNYWLEQLALRRNHVIPRPAAETVAITGNETNPALAQTILPIEELPGISREEIYRDFIAMAIELNSRVTLDDEQKQIFWKASLGCGKGAGNTITGASLYIRRKNKFPKPSEPVAATTKEELNGNEFFQKPESNKSIVQSMADSPLNFGNTHNQIV